MRRSISVSVGLFTGLIIAFTSDMKLRIVIFICLVMAYKALVEVGKP